MESARSDAKSVRDEDFVKHIMMMRKEEQDAFDPAGTFYSDDDPKGEDSDEGKDPLAGQTNAVSEAQRMNFITQLYEDDKFRQEKEMLESQIMQAAESKVESKNFLAEMDSFLKELQDWKKTRNMDEGLDEAEIAKVQR